MDSTALALDSVGVTLAASRAVSPAERALASRGDFVPDPAGRATVRLVDGAYRLAARVRDGRTGRPIRLDLDVTPDARAYYPPLVLRGEDGFESGYVVPAALARARGTIEVAGVRTEFDDALAYHDHNWGTWRDVSWDWGQVQSPDGGFALVYAAVRAPELERAGRSDRPFVLVTARDGFLGVFRPDSIESADWRAGPPVAGRATRVPGTIRLRAATGSDTLALALAVEDVAASPPMPAAAGPRLGGDRVFLQVRGRWTVRGRVGGRTLAFTAPGAAETFVEP